MITQYIYDHLILWFSGSYLTQIPRAQSTAYCKHGWLAAWIRCPLMVFVEALGGLQNCQDTLQWISVCSGERCCVWSLTALSDFSGQGYGRLTCCWSLHLTHCLGSWKCLSEGLSESYCKCSMSALCPPPDFQSPLAVLNLLTPLSSGWYTHTPWWCGQQLHYSCLLNHFLLFHLLPSCLLWSAHYSPGSLSHSWDTGPPFDGEGFSLFLFKINILTQR